MSKQKMQLRNRRHRRIRSKVSGDKEIPRLSAFRSNQHIWLQLIDDESGKTLVSASDKELGDKAKGNKVERSKKVGELLASKALKEGIKRAVFDRGGFLYHGRIKAACEGAREGGLKV